MWFEVCGLYGQWGCVLGERARAKGTSTGFLLKTGKIREDLVKLPLRLFTFSALFVKEKSLKQVPYIPIPQEK